jgi:hypothetical protein
MLLRTELPDATFVIVAHREPQGLADVVRIELSKAPTNNVTLASDNPLQNNLMARMG